MVYLNSLKKFTWGGKKIRNQIIVLILTVFFIAIFCGSASAATLNITDVGSAATGVKNYTATHSHVPSSVDVSDKNSTIASFLNTMTTYVVQLNKSVTTPVTIKTVTAPSGPSGTATGTLQKSEYVTVANNIANYITTNGQAPNYASSSLGNIRYESLIYTYSNILDYYKTHGQLPTSQVVTNIAGVNTACVIIDNTPPTVTPSLSQGTYNTLKNVTLTATDDFDTNPTVYYSTNNGTTWSNHAKSITLLIYQGITNLKYYGKDAPGNIGTTKTATYTIDTTLPNFSKDDLSDAWSSVQSYVEKNHKLPNNVILSGTAITMPQLLQLEATVITDINNNITISIPPGTYNNATNPSENITISGNITKANYLTLATTINSYMSINGIAPNYESTSLGNMRYENLVYTFAQILNSYTSTKVLPNIIIIQPWSLITNNNTVFIAPDQIQTAAKTVQSYIETNHQLPDHVTILSSIVTMPQFLKLEITYIINGYNNLTQSLILKNFGTAPNPSESITGGNLNCSDYLSTATNIINWMNTNGAAPNYASTVRGSIRYESLVYIYAELIDSTSKTQYLPSYIALTPWTTVSNHNTIFITMNQINSLVWTVKSYVETNHTLPTNVTINGRQVTMPNFLMLETTALENINSDLDQSIILGNYGTAPSPSDAIMSGTINNANYLNTATNTISFMNDNGRAPNYEWTSQGNMQYENLIYMFSQILNYYNVNNALPSSVTVNSWAEVKNSNTVTFDTSQITTEAGSLVSFIESNNQLPTYVTISGTQVTMPDFLRLLTTTLNNINGNYAGELILESYGYPTSYSENITGGILTQSQYSQLAIDVEYWIYNNGRAMNFQNTTLGNMRYESLVYMYSQILNSYKMNNCTLPALVTVRPWAVVSSTTTNFFTIDQLTTAANTIKSYVETNHSLPTSVNISGTNVTMPQFLKLAITTLVNINGTLNSTLILQNYNAASSPSETITGGSLNNTAYLNLANIIISYMDSNGKAPNYENTTLGSIRYESLVYMFSLILNYYNTSGELTQNVTITPWALVSNGNNTFFTTDQIQSASQTVQAYVETNHQLPANVTISAKTVTMAQFLQLEASTLLDINDSLYTSIILKNYTSAPSPSETINTRGTITQTDYLNLASNIISYMYANGTAPNYQTINMGNMRFESLVYLFSQILNSYNATGSEPDFATVIPWTVVSNSSTVFITTNQIQDASESVKIYVDTNHQLPNSVIISGIQVTMPQFTKLSAEAIINIESDLYTSIILDIAGNPANPLETITNGTLYDDEFVALANNIKSFMDVNGIVPNYVNSSIGNMRFESLTYMFSNIMTLYNATEAAPDEISVVPWLALTNPTGILNFRTQEIFNTIQDAVDSGDTLSGDTIWLGNATYTENVIINKKIIIGSIFDSEATVQALNPNLPVFTINPSGNGTTIQNLIINGSIYNVGIYINNSTANYILENNITGNGNGICLYNSTNNVISTNDISNNSGNGVIINIGSDNEISGNKLTFNSLDGVNIQNSDENRVLSNIISNNFDGIYLNNSSTDVHFNQIIENSKYGLENEGNGTINATDNWWGSDNPIVSSNQSSDIYTIGGIVTYDPYLILSLNSSNDRSNSSGGYYDHIVSADLTHDNHGNDTSPDGNIPDGIPFNFNSTLGIINSSNSTSNGRVRVKLTNSSAGTAIITVTIDNQSVFESLNITNVNVLGVCNTRTLKRFATIQAAVDDVDTHDGDTITLDEGTYIENVSITKQLSIIPFTNSNVTVQTNDPSKSVFVINNDGSGSSIRGLNIIGSIDSYGIALSHAYNSSIFNNSISISSRGIYLYMSGSTTLNANIITNSNYGIVLYNSINNNISNNTLINNEKGIYLLDSDYNKINGNILNDNYYGTYIYDSSNNEITGNNITNNWVGVYLYETNNNLINGTNFTGNGAGITYYNSINTTLSSNNFTDNWITDTSVIDSGNNVLATTPYTCGPAALATVLESIGIYTTEAQIAQLSNTDESGTTLYGMVTAAQYYGVTALAGRLTTNQLAANYIVLLSINGVNHFEVIENITNSTVCLFDPNIGNINMSIDQFNGFYTGFALILNGTLPVGVIALTNTEMQNIKGDWHYVKEKHSVYVPGYFYKTYVTKHYVISIPYIYFTFVPVYTFWGVTIGYYWPHLAYYHLYINQRYAVWHYVPGYIRTYYTLKKQYDFNWRRVGGILGTGLGISMIGGGVVAEVGTGGTIGTAAAIPLFYFGGTAVKDCVQDLIIHYNDPWWS